MKCSIWDELYEDYEKAMLKRVEHRKKQKDTRDLSSLERLNLAVTQALQELRKHERDHRCNGWSPSPEFDSR